MTPEQSRDGEEFPFEAVAGEIRAARGRLSAPQRAEGARELLAKLGWGEEAAHGGRRGVRRWAAGAVAFAVLASALGVFAVVHRAARALSYSVDGGRVERNGFIESDAVTSLPTLRFSDGSRLALDRGTRASLGWVDGRGARVAITDGSAHVDIVHRPKARWLFDAGPFLISVTGTAFTFGWKPGDEQLDVQMERGSVEVSGPLSDGVIALRSGQHLTVRVRDGETVIRDVETAANEGAPAATNPAPIETVKATAAPEASPGASVANTASSRSARDGVGRGWSARLAAGDFEGIVRQAQRSGIETCLADASSGELTALADAARYSRHDDIARKALVALERRFPQSAPARDAAFLLGRLEETQGATAKAVSSYDEYLQRSPSGTYASEALGREMTLTQLLSGDAVARKMASEYLDRFPGGTYASRARSIAQSR
ncbi:MAG TPA: FecR domain-containing protein [Polyangiaceae bacterium]|jgi:TolA-binding protein